MAFEFDVIASSKDSNPTIANYRASINDALNEVTLEATIADTKGLAAYAFTTSNIKPASDYSGWIPVEGKTQEVSAITKQSGTYYLWVKDDADNIVSSSVLYIYEITFSPGEGEGIMPTILKVQNIDVVLPTVTFTKAGYEFKQWAGNTAYYGNETTYSNNANDTLVAQWTNELFEYHVEYYYMEQVGEYKANYDFRKT